MKNTFIVKSEDLYFVSSLARAAAVAFALAGAGLLYYEHLNRFLILMLILIKIL